MNKNGNHKPPGTIPDKLKPHNVEAEEALLGCVLISADALINTAKLKIVPGDFFIERHAWIWTAAKHLAENNAPVDMVSLTDELARRGQLDEAGGSAYLGRLLNSTPSHIYADHYGQIVKRTSIMRQLIDGAGRMSQIAFQDEIDAQEAIEMATGILLDISKHNVSESTPTMEELGNRFLDRLERLRNCPNGITGLPTGLTDLDKTTGGLQPGDYIVLAGRPSMGKSALALQIAINAAKNYNARSLIYTREMSEEALHQRMVSYESGVDLLRIRKGEIKDDEWPLIIDATERLSRLPLVIDSETDTPESMKARAIIEREKNGLDLVIVDYIQRVTPPNGQKFNNKSVEIGTISGGINRIAKDLNLPVIAISSLSRQCEMRADKRPHLSDLRESGDIEYDADLVWFMYRDEVYNKDTQFPSLAELNIEKNRQGPLGSVTFYFKKHITKFCDLVKEAKSLGWIS